MRGKPKSGASQGSDKDVQNVPMDSRPEPQSEDACSEAATGVVGAVLSQLCRQSAAHGEELLLLKGAHHEAVPRTPWLGYGIQPVSGPLTPCTEGKTPVDAPFRAVKPRIGNRCTASGDLYIRISGINRALLSYCFRQFLCFRSDIHCFDCWRLDRDFTVTASLTVYNGNFNAIRHEGSKAFRNCMDASAILTSYTRNLNPNFSGCRNRIFDFDIPALELTSFEWT